jgi:hypothetical protein
VGPGFTPVEDGGAGVPDGADDEEAALVLWPLEGDCCGGGGTAVPFVPVVFETGGTLDGGGSGNDCNSEEPSSERIVNLGLTLPDLPNTRSERSRLITVN